MIKCEISGEVIELTPAQATQLMLQVINQSPVIDYFTLKLLPGDNQSTLSLDPNWVTFSPPSFSLRPAQLGRSVEEGETQQSVTIIISLPPGIPAGSYTAKVQVAARTGPDNSAEVPLNLVVSEVEDQTLTLEPLEQISRSKVGIFRISLTNRGNMPHLYSVYGEDEDNKCQYEVRPPEVMLEQGQDALLTLRVRPRSRNWASEDVPYPFTLKLEGFSQETSGRFVQRCALPPLLWLRQHWGRVAIAGMVVLALIVGVLVFILLQIKPAIAADVCGPPSTRRINLLSNNQESQIWVSGPNGTDPLKKEVDNLDARTVPGLFYSLISVSPDGRRLAYVAADNQALDGARIFVVELDGANRQAKQVANVPTTGLWPTAPVWSADGTQLAFVARPNTKAAPATTAAATTVVTGTVATATPSPQTSPVATFSQIPPLELWLVSNTGDAYQAKQLATPDKTVGNGPTKLADRLRVDMFYGEQRRTLCWTVDNQNILINPKPGDVSAKVPTKVTLTGDVRDADVTGRGATFTAPTIAPPKLNSGPDNNKLFAPNLSVNNEPDQQQKQSPCAVPQPYSQNDPRWADRILKERSKMSDTGCAIVAGAMYLNSVGVTTNPNDLINNCLGTLAYPLDQKGWTRLEVCSNNKLKGGIRGEFTWPGLDAALKQGPAIVGLLGGQTGSHFVIVTSGGNAVVDSYYVTDPWDGSTYKNLDYFLSKGYRVKWLVSYDGGPGLDCGGVSDTLAIELDGVRNGELSQQSKTVSYDVNGSVPVTASVRYFGPKGIADQSNPEILARNQRKSYNQEGLYLITFDASSTQNSVDNVYFVIDNTPPILDQPIYSTAPNKEGKYLGPVTVQFKAIDALSGIAEVEYKIDNDADWQEYNSDTTTNPLVLKEGVHTIFYAAQDGAGNRVENAPVTIEVISAQPKPTATPAGVARPGTGTPGATNSGQPGQAGQPGQPGGQAIQPARPTPTRTLVPTSTPRPTPLPTSTPVPTFTRLPTSTPVPTFTPLPKPGTTTSGAGANGTPTVTATPQLNPILAVSTTQLIFDTNTDTQTLQISNKGSAPLAWSLKQGQNSDALLNFSSGGTTIAVGGTVDLTVRLKSLNLNPQTQTADFQITSSVGNLTVRATIIPQALPFAVFSSPSSGTLDTLNVSVSLSVTVPGLAKPSYAVITANYKDPITGLATDFVIAPRLTAAENWTFVWNTAQVPGQSPVKLTGQLCVDAAGTVCKQIQTLAGLSFILDAAFVSPITGQSPITDTISVVMTRTSRVDHVSLSYSFSSSSTVITPTINKVIPPSMSLIIPTNVITPTTFFRLRGLACSSVDDSVCRQVSPFVGSLATIMTATVVPSQDLNTVKTLPDNLSITINNPTTNINHVSLYATYKASPDSSPTLQWLSSQTARRSTAGTPPWNLTWNTLGIPYQINARLEVRACYTIDESICTRLASYDGLTMPYALPYTISTNNQVQYSPFNPFTAPYQPLQVIVKDANGQTVSGEQVSYSVPAGIYGSYSGSNVVATDAFGTAATTYLPTNNTLTTAPGRGVLFEIVATVNGKGPGGSNLNASFTLYNVPTNIYSGPAQYYYNGIYLGIFPSTARVTTAFTSPLRATLLTNVSGVSGFVRARIAVPRSGPSAIFITPPGSVQDGGTTFTSDFFLAQFSSGSTSIPIRANTLAGTYSVLAFSDDFQPGTGAFGSPPPPNPPGYYTFTANKYPPTLVTVINLPDTANKAIARVDASNNQSAVVGANFAERLQVKVTDSNGNPLVNETVTFTIQAGTGGATGSFQGSVTAITNSAGVAFSPPLVASTAAGSFTVNATIGGVATPVAFNLINIVPA